MFWTLYINRLQQCGINITVSVDILYYYTVFVHGIVSVEQAKALRSE